MSFASRLRLGAVLVGALFCVSGAASAAPADLFRDLDACRFVSPTFEPLHKTAAAGVARYLGGATVKRPVASPCPRGPRGFDA